MFLFKRGYTPQSLEPETASKKEKEKPRHKPPVLGFGVPNGCFQKLGVPKKWMVYNGKPY